MKNRWIALLLALSLLASSGCGLITRTGNDPKLPGEEERLSKPGVTISPHYEESTSTPAEDEPAPEEEQPPEESKLAWCTDPVLTAEEMPGNYRNLELPVEGSTGYTSVILPLWANLDDWETANQALEEWRQMIAEEEAAAAAAAQAGDMSGDPSQTGDDGSVLPPLDPLPEPTGIGSAGAAGAAGALELLLELTGVSALAFAAERSRC